MGNCINYGMDQKFITSPKSEKLLKPEEFSEEIKFTTKKDLLKIYSLVRKIGKNKNSSLFLALNKKKQKVLLKVLKKSNFLNQEQKKKYIFEQKTLKKLNHKNILKTINIYQTQKRYFIEQEYTENGNLLNLTNSTLMFTLEELKQISAQIISGLIHLHERGLNFGNLRAENIYLSENGVLKLKKENLLHERSILNETLKGTLSYLAPEYFNGGVLSNKTDFWALGVLVYFLWFRAYPFDSINPEELFRNISTRTIKGFKDETPPELKLFIIDLLEVDPKKRIGDSICEFKKHVFFRKTNWKHLLDRKEFSYVQSKCSFSDDILSYDEKTSIYDLEKKYGGTFDTNFCLNFGTIVKKREKLHTSNNLDDKMNCNMTPEREKVKSNYNNF